MNLSDYKRIVIKIGSSLLVDDKYEIKTKWLESLIADIDQLYKQGIEMIIVSSGAVALGRKVLNCMGRRCTLAEKQAASAIGQIKLSQVYQSQFATFDINSAQVLLNIDDIETRQRYVNAQNTLETLLKFRVIPIINENDTVATTEISYGDNDRLAARVAQTINADLLILFSDIDGLYTANPNIDKQAKFIKSVDVISDEIKSMAGESHTKISSGGMITKILAAEIAVNNGCNMLICNGKALKPLTSLQNAGRFTLFKAQKIDQSAKKRWLAHHVKHSGALSINEGALRALRLGKSLLSVGVIECIGNFKADDVLTIKDEQGNTVAVGVAMLHAEVLKQVLLAKSYTPETKVIVHRNNMVLV
ncbi:MULTISPECIES: glutamate 5-kinase [Cysteiniphilum]|uniref:glutamate 5-kinase n=1 Tax=Cysteiniphilum TaxID=2056696 RepID=UPI00177CC2EC|nr:MULTISPECIES: glutamate 5-kinase [Cysteiniphilum]